MLSINTNLSSLIAQNSLSTSTNKLNQAVERMSTGSKINHAKDNAANYSISTNMTTRIGAYDVAEDNTEMGLDMITTASDTVSLMLNQATKLRELAISAKNGVYGAQSLKAIQTEANVIYEEIANLYSTTKYNGINMFNNPEYNLPEGMPKADDVTGFIDNPYEYSDEYLENVASISEVTQADGFLKSEYKIESVEDLAYLAKLTNNGINTAGKTFILAKDLDLKKYCEDNIDDGGWTRIGNSSNPFKGKFNGNGHVIENLYIDNSNNNEGLFGYISGATIKNIELTDADVKGNGRVGLLVGRAVNSNKITNCSVTGEVKGSDMYTAGICGDIGAGSIVDCYASVTLDGKVCGGIVGSTSNATIENCFITGYISASSYSGGIVGEAWNNITIDNCFIDINTNDSNKFGNLIGRFYTAQGTAGKKISNIACKDLNLVNRVYENISGTFTYISDYDFLSICTDVTTLKKQDLSTILQVGIKGDETSQIDFNLNFELDLGKIVRNGIDSDESLGLIDDFINILSAKQTEYGSAQNRLMSVLDEIQIQKENLVSSRSTLQDADMADVSSTYIQQQILQQASATLMSTANQAPAIALQLL